MPRHRHALAGLLSLALMGAAGPLASTAAGAPAAPRDPAGASGAAALEGYDIVLPGLEPLTIDGEATTIEEGIRANAGYVIEKPADWNGELVMWAHGYRGTGTTLTVDAPAYELRQRFLEQGYAWAASSYARNGYDVGTGVTTTRDLARYARSMLGAVPKRTYITGVSMGGHVIGRSLEEYPGLYDGAMPMCGVLGDVELFDYFLSYNLAAQELAGVDAYPFPDDYYVAADPQNPDNGSATDVASQIQAELGLSPSPIVPPSTPEGLQLRAVTADISGGPRPGAAAGFGVFQDFLFSLGQPDDGGSLALNPGRVAQNLDTAYVPNSPVDLNDGIERVAPTDPQARSTKRLDAIPVIDGKPKAPVLSLHGLGDLFVPFSMEQIYASEVAANGRDRLLVQRAIRSVEHCDFTATEAGEAWDDLTAWVESLDARRSTKSTKSARSTRGAKGVKARQAQKGRVIARPEGDLVLDPTVVAQPTYGCRFTDRDATQGRPSRALVAFTSDTCAEVPSAYGG